MVVSTVVSTTKVGLLLTSERGGGALKVEPQTPHYRREGVLSTSSGGPKCVWDSDFRTDSAASESPASDAARDPRRDRCISSGSPPSNRYFTMCFNVGCGSKPSALTPISPKIA